MITTAVLLTIADTLHEAAVEVPTHGLGETATSFLWTILEHLMHTVIHHVVAEVTAIGTLLMRFAIMQWLRTKIKNSWDGLQAHLPKKIAAKIKEDEADLQRLSEEVEQA